MDTYSSSEELLIKARKPYTITKQRERWTEEEHNRFLEALKLYGRAWQRIEEHIGTKTAVQIRSHAQKFFTKLEKEALVKGVPIRQALDIEIPPPRPKRKPSNPYPRKTSTGTLSTQLVAKDGKTLTSLSSLPSEKQLLDLEKEPVPEKFSGDEKLANANEDQDEENCTAAFPLSQDPPSTPFSLANKISTSKPIATTNSCSFGEFVPILGEVNNQDETNDSYIPVEPKGNQKLDKHDNKQIFQDSVTSNTSNFGNSRLSHENLVQGHNSDNLSQPGNFGSFLVKDTQAAQNYPRHVPVHIIDGSLSSEQNISSDISFQEPKHEQREKVHGQTNLLAHQSVFTTSESHNNASSSSTNQTFPTFHPLFTPIRGTQDDYRSLLNISSTFSSFLVSALLQNPAAHAAASFAAAFWPCANLEASTGDSAAGALSSEQLNSSAPSIAAIAAATVAAATAWWATHGLLPSSPPFHSGFTCTPSTFATPMDKCQPTVPNIGRENTNPEGILQEKSMHAEQTDEPSLQKHSALTSPTLLSSENSKGSGERNLNDGLSPNGTEQAAVVVELNDSSKAKNRKQVDRSSCGSNTTSSSDVETDALEKQEDPKEELKEADASHPSSDSSSRRSRSYISLNDSWKEVSEEGRLAFRALFSREKLPQSFSPPQDLNSNVPHNLSSTQDLNSDVQQRKDNMECCGEQNSVKKYASASNLDLNRKLWISCSSQQPVEESSNTLTFLRAEQNVEQGGGMLSMGLGQVKLKAHRTGFKPYKKCSVEAKESRMACTTRGQNDEKCPKRMRLGEEAST